MPGAGTLTGETYAGNLEPSVSCESAWNAKFYSFPSDLSLGFCF